MAAVVVFVTTYSLILPAITIEVDQADEMAGFDMEMETRSAEASVDELLSSGPEEYYGDTMPFSDTDNSFEANGGQEELLSSGDSFMDTGTSGTDEMSGSATFTAGTDKVEAAVSCVSGNLLSSRIQFSLKELNNEVEEFELYRQAALAKACEDSFDMADETDWSVCDDVRIFDFGFSDPDGFDAAPAEKLYVELSLAEPIRADLCRIILLTDNRDKITDEAAGITEEEAIEARSNDTLQVVRNDENEIVGLNFKAERLSLAALLTKTEPEETTESAEAAESSEALAEEPAAEQEDPALLYPAQKFEGNTDTVHVSVKAGIGAFPPETTMTVEDIDDTDTLAAIEGAVEQNVAKVHAVEITFFDKDGNEIEPLVPVHVIMTAEESATTEEVKVIHVDNEGVAAEVEDADLVERDGEVQAQVVEQASFDAAEFSIYALVYTVYTTVISDGGETYNITVTYGSDAGVPEGAYLTAEEILPSDNLEDGETDLWQDYVSMVGDTLGWEGGSASYIRLFDISIVDENGEKVQIEAPVDVEIELADKSVTDPDEDTTQVVHFADGAQTGDVIENVETEGGTIRFEAEGFSAYAIVDGPEGQETSALIAQNMGDLTGTRAEGGFYLSVKYGGSDHYFTKDLNSNDAFLETTDISSGDVWYLEPTGDAGQFRIYTLVDVPGSDPAKKYIRQKGANTNLVELADEGSVFEISKDSNGLFYFKLSGQSRWLQHSGSGNGIRFWTDNKNKDNSRIRLTYASPVEVPDDVYQLDGKTYGLMNWNGGVAGKAMMSGSLGDNALQAKALTVMSTANNSDQLFVPNESDISMWTFHWVSDDKYTITTVVDGSTKYLRIDGNGVTLVSTPDENCEIQVVPGSGTHAGEVCLKAGNTTLTYSGAVEEGFSVGGSAGSEWLHFVELSELTTDYFLTYSATKISVSDENITNGSRVIVYTRSWNEEKKQYDLYAISSDGTLVPVYESGGSIQWVSGQLNTLLWNFTEYYLEGTTDPSYYYELYNQYSEKYVAPQVTDGQILSEDPIGINMNGRRDGQYYSNILAWDDENYSYAGLKVEDGHIVSCPKSEAMDFYFATMEDLSTDDALHTVQTVDHTQYGITMKMIDLDNGSNNAGAMSQLLGSSAGGMGNVLQQGLLSTQLDENGYPKAVLTGRSLSELYSGSGLREVNHLFIDNIYRTSGYFEYDSSQNFASLNNGNDFTVYKELGSYDSSNKNTLKHGQFFPFNDLKPGIFTSVNKQNTYDILANALPESDPRKYEQLYSIEHDGKKVDPHFAMELEAGFTQTPSGVDAWGHDIIFEFTGDDDFWLYVDDELVIDLGGIHSAVGGKVNFRTGEVYVNGTWTTLRQVFEGNYRKRNPEASEGDVAAYLNKYFEEGSTVFRDYTNHTMRIFYMERGAGASNLQMRFNLAAVKKGTVQLSKKLSGVDESESVMAEFPYQILYKMSDAEDAPEYRLQNKVSGGANRKDYVFYKDSVKPVKYAPSIEIGGVAYQDVFFLKPNETADINFPESVASYRIVECGVNTEVYDSVEVNETEVTGTASTEGSETYKDFGIDYATTDDRARVNYVNAVNPDALRNLTIKKELYDESGETRIHYNQDKTLFAFRLYLASEYDTLDVANMHTYHVKDPDGYYCRWNAAQQKFVKMGSGISEYDQLSADQKTAASFSTSVYGQISKIPADYTVEIRNVLAGTQYRVEERSSEIPDGYSFQRYEDFDTANAVIADRNGISGINGKVVPENASVTDPNVTVRNLKGWGLRVNKVWSDEDYMSDRDPTYFAVFVRKHESHGNGNGDGAVELVEGTVRQLKYDDNPHSLYWYFDKLKDDKELEDYIIREVRLDGSGWQVGEDGTVTGINSHHVKNVHEEGTIKLSGTQKGETTSSEFQYNVIYDMGETADDSNVRVDTVTNNRPGIILKKAQWDGETPLAGASFTLKDNEGNLIGSFTSDEEGMITVAFLRDNVAYTLTETDTPQGWYGLQTPMTITLDNKTITVSGADESDYIVNNHTSTPTLIVKDRPYTFQAVKKDGDDKSPISGVTFDLHKQVSVDGVTAIDLNPMPGYTGLVTGPDGVIPKIDNTLPAGTYELREKTTPGGYQPLSGYIQFTVSDTGAVSLVNGNYPEGVSLSGPEAQGDADGTVSFVLSVLNFKEVDITLQKVDNHGNPLTGAKFQLCKYGTSWEAVSGYSNIDLTRSPTVTLSGLKNGRYRLTETIAPEGYVILSKDVYFNIGVNDEGETEITLTDEEGTGPASNSSASVDGVMIKVANTPGAALPATGGPGTKLFYLIGSFLTLGAGMILLLMRRRRTE